MQKPKIVGEIKVQHEYFGADAPMKGLQFGPGILNGDSNLRLKTTTMGAMIYNLSSSESSSPAPLLIPFIVNDPSFLTYTKIDFNVLTPGKILYFDAAQAKGNTLPVEGAEILTLYPSKFVYPLEKERLSTVEKVTLGSIDGEEHVLTAPSNALENGYPIDLSGEGSGGYQITFTFADQSTKTDRFFVSDGLYQQRQSSFAVLSWQPEAAASPPSALTISFSARATYWRYLLIGLSAEEASNTSIPAISVGGQEIAFIREEEAVLLSAGQNAYAFHSKIPISLKERPEWKVSMISTKIPAGMQLPYPQPNILKPIDKPLVAEAGYVSEMYVYV